MNSLEQLRKFLDLDAHRYARDGLILELIIKIL